MTLDSIHARHHSCTWEQIIYLPRRESREVQMSSGMCQSTACLSLHGKYKKVSGDSCRTKTPTVTFKLDRRTYRPAWERPTVPFLFKVCQHSAVEIILVQQGLDPVCVVLQILQEHLQIPAQSSSTTLATSQTFHYLILRGKDTLDLLLILGILPVLGDVKQLVKRGQVCDILQFLLRESKN